MRSGRLRVALLAAGVALWAASAAMADPSARDEIAAAADAADRFLQTLDPAQARAAVVPPDSPLIVNWSNLPAGAAGFERNGVRIGDLNDAQRAALHDFLSTALSRAGAELVRGVIAAEGVLADAARASRLGWHPDNYWLAFFGEPSASGDWSWQFGGHHLALNVAVTGGVMSMSPSFIGIEPAAFALDGSELAPLSDHAAGAVALLDALPAEQRDAAIVGGRPRDLYAGAGRDGVTPPTEGSRVAGWPAERQRQLLDLVSLWVGVMPPAAAERRMAEIQAELPHVRFAWNGRTDGTGSIYYRIQGPTLLIEFSTRGSLGADGGHYHSIYRNPTNEYGRDQ
ncbi:MAG: DUF3500 domain-containing protein [Spirochaetaceae bacterium]|nr:DUF3500 domain-containing protein [Spirochaetaceae bacterium]